MSYREWYKGVVVISLSSSHVFALLDVRISETKRKQDVTKFFRSGVSKRRGDRGKKRRNPEGPENRVRGSGVKVESKPRKERCGFLSRD